MAEKIVLILMIVISILVIHQKHLRIAVIWLGVFSLLASVAYLFRHAPDVAIAEAVIGSTLATVLYLVVLRKQEQLLESEVQENSSIWKKDNHTPIGQRILSAVFVIFTAAVFIYLYLDLESLNNSYVSAYYRNNFRQDTAAGNAVAAIYLNYRIYDTLFETLTLLISVIGVIYLSRFPLLYTHRTKISGDECRLHISQKQDEQIAAPLIKFILPFILILGLYIIFQGHITPGGGFQGGAVLSAALILRYLTQPENDIRLIVLQNTEKIFFLLIIILPLVYLLGGQALSRLPDIARTGYLILMNFLIGIKVCCGISIVFVRYVFYESR